MSPSADRTHYRALVAEIAAKAQAKLPASVNGRVESAVRLVLAHDVTPQADGTIEVGSASDPLKTYHLTGATCECQDFTRGQAPEGWCQHRIAAGIAKRVQELLPGGIKDIDTTPAPVGVSDPGSLGIPMDPAPDGIGTTYTTPLPEAPASVNVRLTIDGRDVQLTLRDSDEGRLLQRLAAVLAQYPQPQPTAQPQGQLSPQQHNAAAMHKRVTDFCPVHQVAMQRHENAKGTWYSHYVDGKHCKGR